MKLPTSFAIHLRNLRESARLSQTKLAQLSKLDPKRLSALETGSRTPSSEESAAIALALGLSMDELTEGTDWTSTRARCYDHVALATLRARDPALVRPALPFEKHLAAARRLNSTRYTEFCNRIDARPERLEVWKFLRDAWVDSGPEAMFWLNLASNEPLLPVSLPLLPLGLRQNQPICPATQLPNGDLPRMGLWSPKPYPVAFFPQITVFTRAYPVRMDCFACFGKGQLADLEVDGAGHDFRRDDDRAKLLSFPVWHFTTADAYDLKLFQKITALFEQTFLPASRS